jgi:hypothetical protein
MRNIHSISLVITISTAIILCIGCSGQKVNKEAAPVVEKLSATHIGSWMRVKSVETWNRNDGTAAVPETSTTNYSDTIEILVVAESTMTTYHKFSSECYSVYKQQYTFSGDTVLASRASENPTDSAFARSTCITLNQGQLVEVSKQSFSESSGKKGWEQFSNYYAQYTGAVPPESWPKAVCTQAAESSAK